MLSSVTPLHFLRLETQGTLSSINEEKVPVGLVFVKPNYIHSVGKVRINLSNPFWMCRMHHTIPHWKYPLWCWRELAEQKHCAVMVYILPIYYRMHWKLYSTLYKVDAAVGKYTPAFLKTGAKYIQAATVRSYLYFFSFFLLFITLIILTADGKEQRKSVREVYTIISNMVTWTKKSRRDSYISPRWPCGNSGSSEHTQNSFIKRSWKTA